MQVILVDTQILIRCQSTESIGTNQQYGPLTLQITRVNRLSEQGPFHSLEDRMSGLVYRSVSDYYLCPVWSIYILKVEHLRERLTIYKTNKLTCLSIIEFLFTKSLHASFSYWSSRDSLQQNLQSRILYKRHYFVFCLTIIRTWNSLVHFSMTEETRCYRSPRLLPTTDFSKVHQSESNGFTYRT